MIVLSVFVALLALALVTQALIFFLERKYPAQGKFVEVEGARIQVIELGPKDAPGLPIVMIHGANSSLQTMRIPVGDILAKNRRVILIDRPGHGWSTRDRIGDSTPAIQGRMVDEALGKLGIDRAIFVAHSWAGSLAAAMALDYPKRVAGLVMLSPVAYPWPGGVGFFNELVTKPIIGPLFDYTITLPLGLLLLDSRIRHAFAPRTMPAGYLHDTAAWMVIRPRIFLNNGWDLVTLKPEVARKSLEYPKISIPVVVITGDTDNTVSPAIHSRAFAAAVPGAKLIVLPNVGHVPQVAAPDLIVREIQAMGAKVQAIPAVIPQ